MITGSPNTRGKYLSEASLGILETRLGKLKNKNARVNQKNEIIAFTDHCRKDFLNITTDDVTEYLEGLLDDNRTPETVKVKLYILKGMAKACDQALNSSMVKNVFAGIRIGADKDTYTEKDLASLEEVDKVLDYCKRKGDAQLPLIIGLALECAMPLRDLIGLKVGNIHLNELGQPFIRLGDEKENYKGELNRFVREIPLKEATAAALNRLVSSRGNVRISDPVFLDRWGKELNDRKIQMELKKANAAAGVPAEKTFTISKLNNLAVVAMSSGGAKDGDLADQLGHTSSWMSRYASITKDFSLTPIMMNHIHVTY